MILDGKCPKGPIETSWDRHRFEMKLVNPANKRKYKVLVVGTGLAPPFPESWGPPSRRSVIWRSPAPAFRRNSSANSGSSG